MNIGLSSFLFFYYSLGDAIRKTAEAGYDAIDIWGGRPHAYRKDLAPDELRELNTLLDQHHLRVSSFIPAQFRYPTSLCSCNETIRQDSVAYILDAIETAAALRAPVVSVCPGHTLYGQSKKDAWGRLEESLGVICQRARQHGLRIALEPADAYETDLMNTIAEAMVMVDEMALPELGIVLDSGHVNLTQESFAQAIQSAGPRLFHVHVADNQGQRDQHLVPGDGTCNFKEMITHLRSAGYTGTLSAELSWDYILDPEPPARAAARRMRAYLDAR
jgi:fructoselysine 3-epimerase